MRRQAVAAYRRMSWARVARSPSQTRLPPSTLLYPHKPPNGRFSTKSEAPPTSVTTPSNEEEDGIAMPDQEVEMKLSRMQASIQHKHRQGDYASALTDAEELLQQTDSHFGRKHPATASAYNNVGLFYKLLGDFVEARKHYSQAMRIYGQVVGRDHASYAMTLHNLGTLNKSQVHFDTSLKATERLALMEKACDYLQEALHIRQVELGDDHPHTVASLSAYGATLAAQVLQQHKLVPGNDDSKKDKDAEDTTAANDRPQYVPLNSDEATQQGWEAAESHLRQALETSIANPRGKPTKKNKKSKKNSKKVGVETLSAATAAQNLAVFLKARAMTQQPYDQDRLSEAQILYQDALRVRKLFLPVSHPDLYATKHSLAELLEATGDVEAANAIRQEILDTYEPEESSENMDESDSTATPPPQPRVFVQQTKAGPAKV